MKEFKLSPSFDGEGLSIKQNNTTSSDNADLIKMAKKKAMNMLIHRDYSRKALIEKLRSFEYSDEVIKAVIDFLDEFGYLNDERVAENLVRAYKANKSRAEMLLILKRKEIDDDLAELTLSNYYDTDIDDDKASEKNVSGEMEVILNLLRKMGMTREKIDSLDFKDKQKLAAKFYRKGFKASNINSVFRMETFD